MGAGEEEDDWYEDEKRHDRHGWRRVPHSKSQKKRKKKKKKKALFSPKWRQPPAGWRGEGRAEGLDRPFV